MQMNKKKYKNEEDYVDSVQSFLESCGCLVWREVVPNECKKWKQPFRVDMIIYREDFEYIGIEAKYFNTLRSGGRVAEAFEQLKKYKPLTYLNNIKIKRWGMLLGTNEYSDFAIGTNRNIKEFLKHFIKHFGFSLVEFGHDYVVIDFCTKDVIKITKDGIKRKDLENY